MVKVEILNDFLVEATSELYTKGWTGEISDALAKRHGKNGTGFVKIIEPKKAEKTKTDK